MVKLVANDGASKPLRLPEILQDSTAPHGEELSRIQGDRILWQLLGLQKPPTDPTAAWGLPSKKVMVSGSFSASAESILRLKAESTPPVPKATNRKLRLLCPLLTLPLHWCGGVS